MKNLHELRYQIIKLELEIEDLLERRKNIEADVEEIDRKISELKLQLDSMK